MKLTLPARSALFSLALGLTLAGCGKSGTPAQQAEPGQAKLAVSAGELVLPAVSGNPGAAYFAVSNGTKEPASLAAVSVVGAKKAEMHETMAGSMAPLAVVTLGPGATLAFERGGKHVMVFGLAKTIKPGDTAKVTLTFSGGKQASGDLKVTSAGGDGASH